MTFKYFFPLFLLCTLLAYRVDAQIAIGGDYDEQINYAAPQEYTIADITISGVKYLDNNSLVSISGLKVGNTIQVPGDKIQRAIEKFWAQNLFDDVKIRATRIQDGMIYLDIFLQERPRMSKFMITGVRKGQADELRDKIRLVSNDVVTDNLIMKTKSIIRKFYVAKGFWDVETNIVQVPDTSRVNSVILEIHIKKNGRVKIDKINITGNTVVDESTLKASMTKTKERGHYRFLYAAQESTIGLFGCFFTGQMKQYPQYVKNVVDQNAKPRIFKQSKYIEEDYQEDLRNIVNKLGANGYRDAMVLRDSVYSVKKGMINIDLNVHEGHKYYFRNITFSGNTVYASKDLLEIIGINKGDVYDYERLEKNTRYNPMNLAVANLYLDNGYLVANVEPVEVRVENDSIDFEIRVHEGKQMRINRNIIKGNTRTSDHVIIREISMRPGQLFSANDLVRSQQALRTMKYFNDQTLQINPTNYYNNDGKVDMEIGVEEASSDQFELSASWAYSHIILSVGVQFNNFSLRNFWNKDAWRPIPSGDGQKLSFRVQSYGQGYFSGNLSFTEPWLGGKHPQSLSGTFFTSFYNNSQTYAKSDPSYWSYNTLSLAFMLARRLNWPDNYFYLSQSVSFTQYSLKNYPSLTSSNITGNGLFHNYSYTISLDRRSLDAALFPRSGSEIGISLEVTPPYSFIRNKPVNEIAAEDRYRWVEFHQWRFNAAFYKQVIGNLVVMARIKAGFIGKYNPDLEVTPFNRYFLGGDGMTGVYAMDLGGKQLIGFRGYDNESLTPLDPTTNQRGAGGVIFNKSTLELRYPLSLNPNSTIFGLVFLEGGDAWRDFRSYNPFQIKRSAGVGVRVFLPMFGLLGLDWGYGIDPVPGYPNANKGQFHFSIGGSID